MPNIATSCIEVGGTKVMTGRDEKNKFRSNYGGNHIASFQYRYGSRLLSPICQAGNISATNLHSLKSHILEISSATMDDDDDTFYIHLQKHLSEKKRENLSEPDAGEGSAHACDEEMLIHAMADPLKESVDPSESQASSKPQPRQQESACRHGRRRTRCKDCQGTYICRHGRIKSQCRDCGSASFCLHGRRKTACKDCGGSLFCSHGRQKSRCKDCGGVSICPHGRRRSQCKDCGGAAVCCHGRRKSTCKACGGASVCAHGRQKSRCKDCVRGPGGSSN